MQGQASSVYTVDFSPTGQVFGTGGYDKTAILWDITQLSDIVARPEQVACEIVGRGLSPTEWATYAPDIPYQQTCAS